MADTTASGIRGLYDRTGAANYLSIGLTKLRKLVDTKEIQQVFIDSAPRYPRASLDAYIERLRKSASATAARATGGGRPR